MNLQTLRARRNKLTADMRALVDGAAAENRDLNDVESKTFDDLKTSVAAVDANIARVESLEAVERAAPPVAPKAAEIVLGRDRKELDAKGGFKSFGEFGRSVVEASIGQRIDPRLRSLEAFEAAAPTTFGNEASGIDGGFLVPPEFARDVFTLALNDDALLPLTDGTPVAGNSMVFPKDETTPWGTDGVRAYWQAEALAGTQTRPKLGTSIMRLHKLMALVPLTDELVKDAPALGAYITPLMARSIQWKTNEAILFGTGSGQPRGMFTSGAAVVQNKDAGQAASTVTIGNVTNMIARLIPGSGPARWLITPDALPSLYQMTLGNYPIFLPVGGGVRSLAGDVNATPGDGPEGVLLGRPLYKSQHAAAFSAQGDLLLVAPQWYRNITKSGEAVEVAQSLHLYFDADTVAFRATFRIDGQPKLNNPVSQAKGANTLSPFIQLQNR